METEGRHCRSDGATLELGAGRSRRSCSSPAEQKELQPSDIATEVAVHATPATKQQSVSSLICSGLQTIHGGRPTDDAWEDNYSVDSQRGDGNGCSSTYREENVLIMGQQDNVASSRLEPYHHPGPLQHVVSHKPFTLKQIQRQCDTVIMIFAAGSDWSRDGSIFLCSHGTEHQQQ